MNHHEIGRSLKDTETECQGLQNNHSIANILNTKIKSKPCTYQKVYCLYKL